MKLSLENWKTFLGPGSIFAEWIKFFAGILSGIVLIGEIGGTAEEDAAAFIKVYTYIYPIRCFKLNKILWVMNTRSRLYDLNWTVDIPYALAFLFLHVIECK